MISSSTLLYLNANSMGKNQSHFLNEVFLNHWGVELNLGAFLIFAYLFTF